MPRVRIRQIKSAIGRKPKHRETIQRLGLRRPGHSVEHTLTPQIKGMIETVHYLVEVKEIEN